MCLLNCPSNTVEERGKEPHLPLSEVGVWWTIPDLFPHCPDQNILLASVSLTSLSNLDSAAWFCFILWRKWHSQHVRRLRFCIATVLILHGDGRDPSAADVMTQLCWISRRWNSTDTSTEIL